MLAVIFVQKIIDTGAHFKVLVHAVSGIGGNHGKTGAAVKIFAHHITFINRHPMLATDQTYQPGTAPVTTFP